MKRLNHLVLGSITVLASVGLAGLFIFPASGEGEPHYNCVPQGEIYECSPVEDLGEYNYTCSPDDEVEGRSNCYGQEYGYLNICYGGDTLTCVTGYKKNENKTDGGYYFTKGFDGDFECGQNVASLGVNDLREVNDFGEYSCSFYGESPEQYNLCKEIGNSMFCLANYDCAENESDGIVTCSENNNSGEYSCSLNDSGGMGAESLDLSEEYECIYVGNGDGEYDNYDTCYYSDSENFICPTIEYSCIAGPGGEYCHVYDPEYDDERGYYCTSDDYFYGEELGETEINNNNTCFSQSGLKIFENCEYAYGEYFCPVDYECKFDEDDNGHYCEPKDNGDYSCRIIYTEGAQAPEIGDEPNSLEAAQGVGRMSIVCTDGEDTITSCQFNEDYPEDYTKLFCPVEIKYDCDSEDGLVVVCNPTTTGNFSCELPIPQDVHTVDYIQDGNVVCGDEHLEYDNCYEEGSKYICPIPQKCDLEAGGYYCSSNRSATDYYYCKFKQLIFDSVNLNQSDSFCERQTEDRRTLPDCYNDGFGEIYCPIKYNCTLQNGMYECSQTNAENEYFYCTSKFHEGVAKASETYMEYDYYCFQPNVGGKQHNDCVYDNDSGKFMCLPDYKCISVVGGYQCDVYDGGGYRCELPSPVFAAGSMQNYVCSGPNTYNNCYPKDGGYFCPEAENTVTIDLYMGGCIPSGGPTAAVVAVEYYCDGNGYLSGVTINANTLVDPKNLTNAVKEKLPDLEEGMEWVWYLENDHNGNKLSENATFAQNSSLYVFSDERKIGTIRFNSNGGTDVPSVTGYYDTSITLPKPTKTGYTFAGWYDGNNKVSMSYKIVGDKTLTAHWTENKPSGGYSGGGGSSSRPSSKGSGPSTTDVKSVDNEPSTPAKEVKAEPKPVVPGKGANSTGKVNSNQELFDAYKWAYDNGLTKYANMSDARMDDLLNRQEMAKISTIFATKFQGETPNEKKRNDCSQYPDLWKTTKDMQEFIIQSCELGYMGYRANGIDYLERFRPYTPVSVAEVSIILSRIMWQNKYAISENLWYQGHLHAVYENNLLDNITKPFDYIARKDAYIMLYRISKTL